MWGNILTEVSYLNNFNMTFSNQKSDVLIHLTQWQYWWWFWFTFLWALYYLLTARIVRYRTLKFNPKLATTLRPHGKWGDLLTCIIPVTWCMNILLNSNFVLKLIEWQSESSLFTLRVRAKQWYWVYKFDLKNVTDIFCVPKNIGRNKWFFSVFGDVQVSEDYLHILQLRSQNRWIKKYWNDLLDKTNRTKKFHLISPKEVSKMDFFIKPTFKNKIVTGRNLNDVKFRVKIQKKPTILSNNVITLAGKSIFVYNNVNKTLTNRTLYDLMQVLNLDVKNHCFKTILMNKITNSVKLGLTIRTRPTPSLNDNTVIFSGRQISIYNNNFFIKMVNNHTLYDIMQTSKVDVKNYFFKKNLIQPSCIELLDKTIDGLVSNLDINISSNNPLGYNIINHSDFGDETRILKKSTGKFLPIRCIKYPIIENSFNYELLRFRFNSSESTIKHKPTNDSIFLTLKQKRYNIRNKINPIKLSRQIDGKKYNYSGNPFLKDVSIIEENFSNPTKQYRMLKKAKNRLETNSINTWNRLLRAKRVLVLPAHVNITAITNSYDIIHSWHIPGLGLKMDCLPGRATHHTFYIDNVGLYFGQCAEICGRYHHHMPIRVCALPFEHFLVWWYSFGLPRLLFINDKDYKEYSFRKFSW